MIGVRGLCASGEAALRQGLEGLADLGERTDACEYGGLAYRDKTHGFLKVKRSWRD